MKTKPEVDRKMVAEIIRELRAFMPFHTLKGNWTLREWNHGIRFNAYLTEKNIREFRAANDC